MQAWDKRLCSIARPAYLICVLLFQDTGWPRNTNSHSNATKAPSNTAAAGPTSRNRQPPPLTTCSKPPPLPSPIHPPHIVLSKHMPPPVTCLWVRSSPPIPHLRPPFHCSCCDADAPTLAPHCFPPPPTLDTRPPHALTCVSMVVAGGTRLCFWLRSRMMVVAAVSGWLTTSVVLKRPERVVAVLDCKPYKHNTQGEERGGSNETWRLRLGGI